MGNPQADVGDTSVWIYWSSDVVDGWICVVDDQANGRGLNYRVLAHRWGTSTTMPEGAFISAGDSFQEVSSGTGQSSCGWGGFSGTVSGGVDFLVVEWEDAWTSSANVPTTHYDGRVTAESPWY